MEKDRTAICNIISEMLDNPDEHGIYPTSTAYTQLERYIEGVRTEAGRSDETITCCCGASYSYERREVSLTPDGTADSPAVLQSTTPPERDEFLRAHQPCLTAWREAEREESHIYLTPEQRNIVQREQSRRYRSMLDNAVSVEEKIVTDVAEQMVWQKDEILRSALERAGVEFEKVHGGIAILTKDAETKFRVKCVVDDAGIEHWYVRGVKVATFWPMNLTTDKMYISWTHPDSRHTFGVLQPYWVKP